MNRFRNEPKTHPSVFITLILAALVVVSGGIMHAKYKNSQVQTERLSNQRRRRQCGSSVSDAPSRLAVGIGRRDSWVANRSA